ncbi:MAG: hypothetical protein ACOWWR_16170, partial [Eubacteriales bacterium]
MNERLKAKVIEVLSQDKDSVWTRIKELERKERNGTIITSSNNPDTTKLDESNELGILLDQYDFAAYDDV